MKKFVFIFILFVYSKNISAQYFIFPFTGKTRAYDIDMYEHLYLDEILHFIEKNNLYHSFAATKRIQTVTIELHEEKEKKTNFYPNPILSLFYLRESFYFNKSGYITQINYFDTFFNKEINIQMSYEDSLLKQIVEDTISYQLFYDKNNNLSKIIYTDDLYGVVRYNFAYKNDTLSRIDIFYSDTLYLKREYFYHREDTAIHIKIIDNGKIFKEYQITHTENSCLLKDLTNNLKTEYSNRSIRKELNNGYCYAILGKYGIEEEYITGDLSTLSFSIIHYNSNGLLEYKVTTQKIFDILVKGLWHTTYTYYQ